MHISELGHTKIKYVYSSTYTTFWQPNLHTVFVFNDVCIHKSFKCRKICYKITFQPEHAEDIGSVYLLNQIFESVSDLFAKEISKWL